MNLQELASQVRETPLCDLLQWHGFEIKSEGVTFRAKNDRHNIVVTGNRWFDNKAGLGGLARIAHTRFRSGSCGDFECGDGVQEADFRAHPALSGLVGVEEWAPGVFLASTMRVWEQGPPLAEASSLSCVNKSSFELQPAGIAQRFAQARRKVSW